MRWLFLFMLALNIAYVGWELSRPPAHESALEGNNGDAPSLVLLRELSQDSASSPAETEPGPPPESPAEVSVSEPDVEPAVPEKVAEAIAQPVVAAPTPTPVPAASAAQSATACYSLGPFREIADLRKLIRNIRDFVAEASFRSRDEREQTMYWVYLPPEKSRAAANALAEELSRKNIRDHYVLNSGEQVNAISLGHFREKDRALSLMNRAMLAGFATQMEPVFKTYTIYWLDYRVQAGRTIPLSALDLSRMPTVSRFDRVCE